MKTYGCSLSFNSLRTSIGASLAKQFIASRFELLVVNLKFKETLKLVKVRNI